MKSLIVPLFTTEDMVQTPSAIGTIFEPHQKDRVSPSQSREIRARVMRDQSQPSGIPLG